MYVLRDEGIQFKGSDQRGKHEVGELISFNQKEERTGSKKNRESSGLRNDFKPECRNRSEVMNGKGKGKGKG